MQCVYNITAIIWKKQEAFLGFPGSGWGGPGSLSGSCLWRYTSANKAIRSLDSNIASEDSSSSVTKSTVGNRNSRILSKVYVFYITINGTAKRKSTYDSNRTDFCMRGTDTRPRRNTVTYLWVDHNTSYDHLISKRPSKPSWKFRTSGVVKLG